MATITLLSCSLQLTTPVTILQGQCSVYSNPRWTRKIIWFFPMIFYKHRRYCKPHSWADPLIHLKYFPTIASWILMLVNQKDWSVCKAVLPLNNACKKCPVHQDKNGAAFPQACSSSLQLFCPKTLVMLGCHLIWVDKRSQLPFLKA